MCEVRLEETKPILWNPADTALANYTSRPEWSSAGESKWMRLSKFSLINRLTVAELSKLILLLPAREILPTKGVDLRCADQFDPVRLEDLLQITPNDVTAAFCYRSPRLPVASAELRYCRECLRQGFHAAWFQWRFISRCPVHHLVLKLGCPRCAESIPYALHGDMAEHPLTCKRCGAHWVPALHLPGWRCTPVSGRSARILRRWQAYIAGPIESLCEFPRRQHDPLKGQFLAVHRSHTILLATPRISVCRIGFTMLRRPLFWNYWQRAPGLPRISSVRYLIYSNPVRRTSDSAIGLTSLSAFLHSSKRSSIPRPSSSDAWYTASTGLRGIRCAVGNSLSPSMSSL